MNLREAFTTANLQEIYDTVAAHLLKQNGKALNNHDRCAYRGADGKTCAVGCLISDDEYRPAFEGKRVNSVAAFMFGEGNARVSVANVQLLTSLQRIHDSNPTDTWRQDLQELARRYDLIPVG